MFCCQIKTTYKSGDSNVATFRALRGYYGAHNHPTTPAIGKFRKNWKRLDWLERSLRHMHNRIARSSKALNAGTFYAITHMRPLDAWKISSGQPFIRIVALWSGGAIGYYLSENNNFETVIINSKRYGRKITYFFGLQLKNWSIQWFQQDVTCHTARANMSLLREKCPGRVISHLGDVN